MLQNFAQSPPLSLRMETGNTTPASPFSVPLKLHVTPFTEPLPATPIPVKAFPALFVSESGPLITSETANARNCKTRVETGVIPFIDVDCNNNLKLSTNGASSPTDHASKTPIAKLSLLSATPSFSRVTEHPAVISLLNLTARDFASDVITSHVIFPGASLRSPAISKPPSHPVVVGRDHLSSSTSLIATGQTPDPHVMNLNIELTGVSSATAMNTESVPSKCLSTVDMPTTLAAESINYQLVLPAASEPLVNNIDISTSRNTDFERAVRHNNEQLLSPIIIEGHSDFTSRLEEYDHGPHEQLQVSEIHLHNALINMSPISVPFESFSHATDVNFVLATAKPAVVSNITNFHHVGFEVINSAEPLRAPIQKTHIVLPTFDEALPVLVPIWRARAVSPNKDILDLPTTVQLQKNMNAHVVPRPDFELLPSANLATLTILPTKCTDILRMSDLQAFSDNSSAAESNALANASHAIEVSTPKCSAASAAMMEGSLKALSHFMVSTTSSTIQPSTSAISQDLNSPIIAHISETEDKMSPMPLHLPASSSRQIDAPASFMCPEILQAQLENNFCSKTSSFLVLNNQCDGVSPPVHAISQSLPLTATSPLIHVSQTKDSVSTDLGSLEFPKVPCISTVLVGGLEMRQECGTVVSQAIGTFLCDVSHIQGIKTHPDELHHHISDLVMPSRDIAISLSLLTVHVSTCFVVKSCAVVPITLDDINGSSVFCKKCKSKIQFDRVCNQSSSDLVLPVSSIGPTLISNDMTTTSEKLPLLDQRSSTTSRGISIGATDVSNLFTSVIETEKNTSGTISGLSHLKHDVGIDAPRTLFQLALTLRSIIEEAPSTVEVCSASLILYYFAGYCDVRWALRSAH